MSRDFDGLDDQIADPSPVEPTPARAREPNPLLDMSPDDVQVADYVKMIYKRRRAAGGVFLVVFLTAVVYTFTATPIFEGRARLLIENDDQHVVSFKAVVEEGQPTPDYYQTQYGVLESRALARRTIDDLRLWSSPILGAAAQDGPVPNWRNVSALFRRAPERTPPVSESRRQSAVIDSFLAKLTIEPVPNSRLVDIKFRATDAALTARDSNQLVKNYIDRSLEYKFTASQDASVWLGARLKEQKQQVEQAEAALQQYRERNDAISPEDRQNIVVQKLAELNTAVTRAKTERLQKEAVERQLRAIEHDPAAIEMFPTILSNAFIQRQKADVADLQRQVAQLADKLGQRHPEMLRQLAALEGTQLKLRGEIQKVVQGVHTEYQAAVAQERSLVAALNQQKAEAQSMNRKAIEYNVLARDVESGRQVYQGLLQRAKETGVAESLNTSNIRIVDLAEEPRGPITPNSRLNMLVGVAGGLILGLAVAFLLEYADSRIKSPDEIKACLGLVSLGMLPSLPERWAGMTPLLHEGLPPNFSEMFRTIRTNILFSTAREAARTLVITSTGPGEGKTLVSSNLAVAFAQAGRCVLLIDADMRRSRLHDVFGVQQLPGLSNVLVGNALASEALQKTSVAGLWVMSAGHTPPNPAELLSSTRFAEFLKSLKTHFDTIIIDTPPAMVVSDPLIMASLADGVVFVVGSEMTSRHAARDTIEQLRRADARLLGAILNRVDIERNGYYYSRYYRTDYAGYYSPAQS